MADETFNPLDLLKDIPLLHTKPMRFTSPSEFERIIRELQGTPYAPRTEQDLLMDYWFYRMFVKHDETLEDYKEKHPRILQERRDFVKTLLTEPSGSMREFLKEAAITELMEEDKE